MRTLIVVFAVLLHALPADAQVPRDNGRDSVRRRPPGGGDDVTTVATVDVPNVVTLSLGEARKAFSARNLRSTAVRIDGGIATAGDIVVRQSPAANQKVNAGTVGTLYVRPLVERVTPPEVQLTPRVIGRSLADARNLVNQAELRPTWTTVPSPDTAMGSVIRQDPLPGEPIRPNRTIDLQVAGVPQVVGLPADAAVATLRRAQLAATATIRELPTGNNGTVLAQLPRAGQFAQPGSAVALTVVRVVEPPFLMPELVGRSIADATRFIVNAGLVLQRIEIAKVEGRPDTAVGQSPVAGTIVRRGDRVTLTNGRAITTVPVPIAVVPRTVAVPNFVGARVDRVGSLRGAKSLRIVTRYSTPAPESKDSVVVTQSLAPGASVPIGSAITLTVSQRQRARLASLRIEPDSVSIVAHDSVRLTVVGVMSDGSRIAVTPSWAATTGSITSDGRYVATGETGRVIVAAAFGGLATTSIIRVERPPLWWWWIPVLAVVVAGLGWVVARVIPWPPVPPQPPTPPVPPLAFTYDFEAPSIETEITATEGHGSNLSLVSYAGESVHALEPAGVELFTEENTHG